MLRAITLDAFGTIIDTGRDVLVQVASAACRELAASISGEALLETWDRYFFSAEPEPFRTIEETTEDSLGRAFQDHGIRGDPRPYVEMLTSLWREAKAYPDARPTLERLRGLPLAVVSNADDAFLREILGRNGLHFDVVVSSESVQAYKPRSKIFEVALHALSVPPSEALHVGDSLAADVAGAKRLGMRTVWVNRTNLSRGPGDPSPDFEIPDLGRIPEIIDHLHGKG
jgi:2-haloacid dehalogenase